MIQLKMRSSACFAALLLLTSCQTGGFGRGDADRDGFLSFDEFSATPVGRASPNAGSAFIDADRDRDGALSSGEFEVYATTYGGR